MKKRLLSILLCLGLLLVPAPRVGAEGGGTFCLFAATTSQILIRPVRVSYSSGQTVQEALDASGWSFGRHGAFIDVIEGTEGGFLICYDGGGYDLTVPAETVTAIVFSENEGVGEEHLSLLRYMLDYGDRSDNAQNYPAAAAAYGSALTALRIGDAGVAQSSLTALQDAVAEYESILNGPKYTVTVTAEQNGASLSAPELALTDAYGNVTRAVGTSVSVPAGTYTVSVSDGMWNRAVRTVAVSGDTELSFALPWGEWFGELRLLDQQTRAAYASVQDTSSHTWTVEVPDTAGQKSPILNAAQGGDVPSPENTRLYGVYQGTDGTYYGNTPRSWSSSAASLSGLIAQGMGERSFTLEARYTDGETALIQSYTVMLRRIPTLGSLSVQEENTRLPLAFEPLLNEYTVTATQNSLLIGAEGFGSGYEITGTGAVEVGESGVCTVTVAWGDRTNSYTLRVQKVTSVDVTLSLPEGTEAKVFNGAGAEILPVSGVYRLIPGESYEYVATRAEHYHARESFTASGGLTVPVAEPDTGNRLNALALYNSSAASRRSYALDEAFTGENHALACTVPDASGVLYAQATAETGWVVQVLYDKQTVNPDTNGSPNTVRITNGVGANNVNVLTGCLIAGGYSQRLTVRVSKTEGTVTRYQDYGLLIRRSEHLKSLALYGDAEAITLLNAAGAAVSFDRDTTAYFMTVDRGLRELRLSGAFINESGATPVCGGYYAEVNGQRYETLSEIVLPLDPQESVETVTVLVGHGDGNAVPTAYTVTVGKTDPVAVTFATAPSGATVFVKDNATGKRVKGEGNTFLLNPGQSYSATVTKYGYVGRQVTDYTAPSDAETVAVELTAAESNAALPNYGAYWSSSRFDEYNNGVVSVRTPVTAESAALYWAAKVGEGYSSEACGCPIIVNGDMYAYAGSRLYRIDTVSGEILAAGTMDHASSFAINAPTYGEGMIFVGLSDGTIQAFNAATLESVWIYRDALKGQPDCPIVYHDGYIYTGFWNGETALANFVCLSVTDEDPSAGKEEKLPAWSYTSKGGFYWAGAYVSDRFLLLCTDDGSIGYTTGYARLLSLDPLTGELMDSYTMTSPGDLRSGVTFVPAGDGGGRGYFTSKGGYFYRVDVTAEGRFGANSLKKLKLLNDAADPANPGMSVSTPTVYNGRAYVGVSGTNQFGQYSGHNITVIDLNSWSIAYTVRTQGYPETSGVLTTAYCAETGCVNVYFFDNYTPGKLRMLADQPGQTAPSPVTLESYTEAGKTREYEVGYVLFTPYGEQAQYCICSPIVDEYGTLYFKNDSAYMMAVGSVVTSLEITELPAKTSYLAGETFDPTGMTVTAVYANGTTKDVTAYVSWSEEALTVRDTQFQVYFPHVMYHDENGAAGKKLGSPVAVLELTVEDPAAVLHGDANGDGVVDARDAARILRYVVGYPTEIDLGAADASGDGLVDARDAARILRYVVGYPTVLGPHD